MERDNLIAIIDGEDGSDTIPDNLDKIKPNACQIIANPPNDWPNATLAQRPKFGRLVGISRPSLDGATNELRRFYDWVVANPLQPGGSVFFNPFLGLRHGDQLLAVYERGKSRIEIPRDFLSTAQKIARASAPEAEPRRISVYDRLRHNTFADTDDDE